MATPTSKKILLALGLAFAASVMCPPSVFAAETKKPAKSTKSKAKKPAVIQMPDGTVTPLTPEVEPDITDTITTDFNCELGNKVTVYHKVTDDSNIAVRWKKRLHRLTRVVTTTGAVRYENPNFGLIWIGIPAKSMLLDSRLNRQLANECMNAEQETASKQPPARPDLVAPVGKVLVEPAIPPGAMPAPVAVPPADQPPAAPAVGPQPGTDIKK